MRRMTRLPLPGLAWLTVAVVVPGCGFDPMAEKYDRVRYEELQKTDCANMAALAASRFVVKDETPDPEAYRANCERLQALTFEQYQRVAQNARDTGVWDVAAALGSSADVPHPRP